MTGRERVRRAVTFDGPDRIPWELPPEYGSDFLKEWMPVGADPDWQPSRLGEDEWGCVRARASGDTVTQGQVVEHPLRDYELLRNYPFPDYGKRARYEQIRELVSGNMEQKFVIAAIPFSLIHRLEYLRGHEEAWTDPYVYPNELGELLDRLADIAILSLERCAEIGIDGIFFADDWGLQDRPMVSPEIFRRFFKPRYARVFSRCHELGVLAFMHSCGYIIDLVDDMIEAGLDVIQMDQQENMGLENLGKRFGGRICFWCPVDIQKTMIEGGPEDVRRYARRLIDTFGAYNGGFIAKWYASPAAAGHSSENLAAMSEAFREYGRSFYESR